MRVAEERRVRISAWLASGAILGAVVGAVNWLLEFREFFFGRSYLIVLLLMGMTAGILVALPMAVAFKLAVGAGIWKRAPLLSEKSRLLLARSAAVLVSLGLVALIAYLGSAPRFAGFLSTAPHRPEDLKDLPPNLILFSFDTARTDHLGAYGYEKARTPVFDGMVAGGTLFERAVAASSWTIPSHAAVLTGVAPSHLGPSLAGRETDKHTKVPDSAVTLAEVLRDEGYHTAGFIGGSTVGRIFGFSQGFEVFNDHLPASLSGASSKIYLVEQLRRLVNVPRHLAFRSLDPAFTVLNNFLHGEAYRVASDNHVKYMGAAWRYDNSAHEVNEKVFRWLDRRPPRPLFLFVHYFDPHDPYEAPPPFGPEGYDSGPTFLLRNGVLERVLKEKKPLGPAELGHLIEGYDAEIAYMDHQLGLLLDRLEAEGVLDNSILGIVSDHGESFMEHGLLFHGHHLYDHLTRSVFLLSGPGVPAGRREDLAVSGIDFMPTVLDLLGVENPPSMQGRSLRPLMEGKAMDPKPVFSEVFTGRSNFPELEAFSETRFTVEMEGMKLHLDHGGRERLFDLAEDPGELVDLLEERPEAAEKLRSYLMDYLAGVKWPSPEDMEEQDAEALEKLRGLGYIQ